MTSLFNLDQVSNQKPNKAKANRKTSNRAKPKLKKKALVPSAISESIERWYIFNIHHVLGAYCVYTQDVKELDEAFPQSNRKEKFIEVEREHMERWIVEGNRLSVAEAIKKKEELLNGKR